MYVFMYVCMCVSIYTYIHTYIGILLDIVFDHVPLTQQLTSIDFGRSTDISYIRNITWLE